MTHLEAKHERSSSKAFNAFCRAIEEGDTTDFGSLVSEDFHFFVPLAFTEWLGEQRGMKRFEELVRFEREVLIVQLTPVIQLEGDDHEIIVFRAEGILNNKAYSNELTIVFHFEDGRIRSFREYVGSTEHLISVE